MKTISKIVVFFFFGFFPLATSVQAKPVLMETNSTSLLAQVTVDGTTTTTVTATDTGVRIENGNREGGNLFHSFEQFSIPLGSEAYFNNPSDLVNIFSRVTGGNISNINGLIRANGGANLFFINPAGIVFGEGAKLQLGGSFYGSTADSIVFSNGEFSATDLDNPPLITINAPIGLNFRDNPQPIINRSVADNLGLQVNAGETFGLIGGDIEIIGNGIPTDESNPLNSITAQGAKVWLGGLAQAGTVKIEENLGFSVPDDVARANVVLANGARVDVASLGEGEITVIGNEIKLEEASQLIGGIAENLGTRESQAGNIAIDATGKIELTEESSIENRVNNNSLGNSGKINVTGASLSLTDGSRLSSSTFGQGNAGDITVKTTGAVTLDGIAVSGQRSRIASGIFKDASGEGGNLTIDAGSLSLTNGALLNTQTAGVGNAGNITVNTDGAVTIAGIGFNDRKSSIVSGIDEDAIGEGGNITIDADLLSIKDGALLDSRIDNNGTGNAGNITIAANSLFLENQAFLSSGTSGQGNVGQISINAQDVLIDSGSKILSSVATFFAEGNGGAIEISTTNLTLSNGGQINANTFGQGDAGKITINADERILIDGEDASGIFSAVGDNAIGNGGDIEIKTNSLTLNAGEINTSSVGNGNGGNIAIFADELNLDEGKILANNQPSELSTEERNGGNITLEIAQGLVRLNNNSAISAQAGENASGGNISIEADLILAFPDQNNDITANAVLGRGGNIEILAESILGIEKRASNPLTNDIDASSESGVDGSVSIKTPDHNAFRETTQLAQNIVSPGIITANACDISDDEGAVGILLVKGKGGVFPEAIKPLNNDALIINNELESSDSWQNYRPEKKESFTSLENLELDYSYIPPEIQPVAYQKNGEPIYLARGVIKQKDGSVILTAFPQNNSVQRTFLNPFNCDRAY